MNTFDTVYVDLIGTYEVGYCEIIMIDHATRWLDVWIQPNKTSVTTAEIFDRNWLCRYPRHVKGAHNQETQLIEKFSEVA